MRHLTIVVGSLAADMSGEFAAAQPVGGHVRNNSAYEYEKFVETGGLYYLADTHSGLEVESARTF